MDQLDYGESNGNGDNVILHDRDGLPNALSEALPTSITVPPTQYHPRRQIKLKQDYEIGELLGRGKFAAVYRCKQISTGIEMAAKIFAKKDWSKAKAQTVLCAAHDL